MATKREYLVSLGLAKEGRGKFSKDAEAKAAEFLASGGSFDEPVKPAPKPKADKPAGVQATPRPQRVKPAPKTNVPAPTPLVMPVRKQTEGYAVERNTLIAFTSCGSNKVGCGKPINFCKCASGPVAPHYLDKGVAGTPLALTKPIV